ncbi:EAL and GGDEF domain-containing protein [Pontibacter sp. JAM-7]|uniref:sensor domain-containing protein n=1 Tax=Pontibacter sp. JAM-7 TaxID=3366581 RepID=UPI003AF981B2
MTTFDRNKNNENGQSEAHNRDIDQNHSRMDVHTPNIDQAAESQLFDAVVASANDAIMVTSLDSVVSSWNPAAAELFGYVSAEMTGQSLRKIIPADLISEHQELLQNMLLGKRLVHHRTRRQHKDGSQLQVAITLSPIVNPHGLIVGASYIAQDISQQVAAEALQSHFQSIIETSEDAIISKSIDGIVQSWNQAAERMFGYKAEEMIGQPMLKIFPPERAHEEAEILAKLAAGKRVEHFRTQRQHKSGHLVEVSVTISPVFNEDGGIVGVSTIARDVTKLVTQERITRQFEVIVESSDDAIISKSLDGIVQSWNPGAERMFGYKTEEMVGQSIITLFPDDKLEEEAVFLGQIIQGRKINHFRTLRLHKSGRSIHVSVSLSPIYEDDRVVGISKIARDITQEVFTQEQIWKQAYMDQLTGLPNRRHFLKLMAQQINSSQMSKHRFALFFIDLDNFKIFNDTYGHDFGDQILSHVSEVFDRCTRATDTVARLGGDEFVIMLPGVLDNSGLERIAENILRNLKAPVRIDEIELSLSASIGVSVYPDDGKDSKVLLQQADQAMYQAKYHGRNQCMFFRNIQKSTNVDDHELLTELGMALERNEFSLHFQPIIDAGTVRIGKAEALLRWTHPKLGMIPPDVFIPLAERYGLIKSIGRWVVSEALRVLKLWTRKYGDDFQISINKSPLQFLDYHESINHLYNSLRSFDVRGRNLIVEVTESFLLDHSEITDKILNAYQEMGVEIAIDDFGTGYSSLAYLNRYSFSYLKIDRTFINGITESKRDFQLCKGIAMIAHELDMKIVAEGVETRDQMQLLNLIETDCYQGYLFSKPLPIAEFETFMQEFSATSALMPGFDPCL